MKILDLKWKPLKLATLVLCGAFVVGCSDDDDDPAPVTMSSTSSMMSSSEMASSSSEAMAMNIVEVAQANGSFTLLLDAATRAGVAGALIENSNLTVFAPTDAAFEKAGITAEVLAGMSEDDLSNLADVLTYHVYPGSEPVLAETALTLNATRIDMFNEAKSILTVIGEGEDAKLFINNAQVIIADVMASNGVIHVIDTVIMPPSPFETNTTITGIVSALAMPGDGSAPEFTRLLAEVVDAELVDVLSADGELTVFAPTDAAFAKLGEGIVGNADVLLYHVLPGNIDSLAAFNANGASPATVGGDTVDINLVNGDLYVNASKVIGTDVITTNGIVHTIDTVLLPPLADTVADVVINNENFSTLRMLLTNAMFVEALQNSDAKFTVFAPTNTAFEKLSNENPDVYAALTAGGDVLADALLYHVFDKKRIFSPEAIAASGGNLTMMNGDDVTVDLRETGLFINESKVETTDILTKNGVIHVIDTVLLPPAE